MRPSSLVTRTSLALAGIVALAAVTMVSSYWISDRADNDAFAINLAGSLRMQTYRLALLASHPQTTDAQLAQASDRLEQSWQHPVLIRLSGEHEALAEPYRLASNYWRALAPDMLAGVEPQLWQPQLEEQVALIEALVSRIQRHAEANARFLRLIQVAALGATLLLAGIVMYWLRLRIAQPLSRLTRAAHRVSRGDFSSRVEPGQPDELGMLASTFNRMSAAIAQTHSEMEERIDTQTQALQRSNTTLQFLYDTAKTIIEQEPESLEYEPIVSRLTALVEADDIELCLITENGDAPYLQIKPEDSVSDVCVTRNCDACLSGDLLTDARQPGLPGPVFRYSFPMMRDQKHYGVLVVRMGEGKALDLWQQQLAQSVADQLALALSLQAQEDNARRLSLAHERTVIARELHDSLAQALSYLKIQVTRLNRALATDDKAVMGDVSRELHEGLSSAYRQLRELLTTFRLKVDGPGLLGALQESVKQLSAQTTQEIYLSYQLQNLPLTPNEEIHLLQIVREATQNAIHHSQGHQIQIRVEQDVRKHVRVSIEDDGVGLPDSPEKLNHYGLAIMQERSKNLEGKLKVRNRQEGGAGVYFVFAPECLRQQNVFARGS